MTTPLAGGPLSEFPHRRFNPLTREWILVSPHRTKRPWQGQIEKGEPEQLPAYDPGCYLCPGNGRAGGARNPGYENTFVFDNDFAALLPDSPAAAIDEDGLLVARTETGVCRVICFSPRHDLTLARMEPSAIRKVIDVWAEQSKSLGANTHLRYVEVFENRGAMMGCSNPHPHCQIWATSSIPVEVAKEQAGLTAYRDAKRRCLLCDYLDREESAAERILCGNDHYVALIPFWAVWPFELMLLPRRHFGAIEEQTPVERDALGALLKQVTTRYDNLFETSFPYSAGFHHSPCDGMAHPEWHMHMHFYPPLLRSATVRKFLVGYEMLANPQRDITPEAAAARLRSVPDRHYTENE